MTTQAFAQWKEDRQIRRAREAPNDHLNPPRPRELPLFAVICLGVCAAGISVCALSFLWVVFGR